MDVVVPAGRSLQSGKSAIATALSQMNPADK